MSSDLTKPEKALTDWLVRDGKVLASVQVVADPKVRMKGYVDDRWLDGALLFDPAKAAHSFGIQFDLDVAFLNVEMVVVRTLRLHRNRIAFPVWSARSVLKAEAGAFGLWDLKIGDVLEVKKNDQ